MRRHTETQLCIKWIDTFWMPIIGLLNGQTISLQGHRSTNCQAPKSSGLHPDENARVVSNAPGVANSQAEKSTPEFAANGALVARLDNECIYVIHPAGRGVRSLNRRRTSRNGILIWPHL